MHTIGGCTWNVVDAGLGFEDPQWNIEGQRVAGTAAIPIRRHDGERRVLEREECLAQALNALGTKTVVVADQYLYRCAQRAARLLKREGATILEPGWRGAIERYGGRLGANEGDSLANGTEDDMPNTRGLGFCVGHCGLFARCAGH